MNKLLVLIGILIILASSALAADVSRSMPSRIEPGKTLTITFNIRNMDVGKSFTLQDKLPDNLKVKTWDVEGAKETKDNIDYRTERNGWSFTAAESNLKITYSIDIPKTASGKYEFDAMWFSPAGQSRDKRTLTVAEIVCGDNHCEGSENEQNCEKDCKKPAPETAGEGMSAITGAVYWFSN